MAEEVGAKQLVEIGAQLGLDPVLDIELTWIVQEYLNAPLPDDWKVIKAPNGEIHYINSRLRYDVLTNPIEPRFKKLVELIKDSKSIGEPLDEVTVLELIDPIERASDVKDMAEFQGIDYKKEKHLLWIAKLALLEALPENWEEFIDDSGRTLYRNVEKGYSTEDHPADDYFKGLIQRERQKRPPYYSIKPAVYVKPVVHYRNDMGIDGSTLRTKVEPASGTYMPFYDLYGQYYWFDFETEKITMSLDEVRREPAATVIQRAWRGYLIRKRVWEMHEASLQITASWRTAQFRKELDIVSDKRVQAARVVQSFVRMRKARIQASAVVYQKLAEVGTSARRLARIQARTGGLQKTGYSFFIIRQKVVLLQRHFRWCIMRRGKHHLVSAENQEKGYHS
ncbi:hypothetical protein CYMTET_37679 [Cymbomonas tetramitiformis]|uniref:WW domain-containing protein n=1 Tax=Cymbomonas tetramitiformis TaxID=36881 RepID=A0AAE0CFN4_9CHLO|nr:hypothetical protein CYMTET_37679 [Cymbomonas tetramitiformis]